jgi:type IV secretion system protein VirB1
MLAATGMMACPNLVVPVEVMRHVVDVESGANPYAIGVVGGQLARQPKNLGEALATVRMLDAKGYNYSLGVAQVNRANLGKYGLDSYEKAFEPCPNLAAGAQILAACYASSGGDWGKAFSCYYSGDFVTGYRDGYVQKVYDSISRDRNAMASAGDSRAIPLKPASSAVADSDHGAAGLSPGMPGYRVAIRSVAFYTTTASAAPVANAAPNRGAAAPTVAAQKPPAQTAAPAAVATPLQPIQSARDASTITVAASTVFVPQVTGPNDRPGQSAPVGQTRVQQAAAPTTSNGSPTPPAQEARDAAFVF